MNSRKIRVAAAQLVTRGDIADNLEQICGRMDEARQADCHVIAFHEGALTGYPRADAVAALDHEQLAQAEQRIQMLAGQLHLAVLVGSCSRGDQGQWFNDVLIVNEAGRRLGRYAKTWRADEPWYAAGSGPVVFTVAGIRSCVIICHDLRYPELVRLPVIAGARLLFIINNESGVMHEHKQLGYRSMQIARATENGIFAVMANAAADPHAIDGSHQSHGQSKIADPLGNVLIEAGIFEQRLVIADLEMAQATAQWPLRTVSRGADSHVCDSQGPEHPAYAKWISDGLSLVHDLDAVEAPGAGVSCHPRAV